MAGAPGVDLNRITNFVENSVRQNNSFQLEIPLSSTGVAIVSGEGATGVGGVEEVAAAGCSAALDIFD